MGEEEEGESGVVTLKNKKLILILVVNENANLSKMFSPLDHEFVSGPSTDFSNSSSLLISNHI